MNAKKKLLFSFAGLILSIAIFSTVVFAWFALSRVTSDITIETGHIESSIELYSGKWDTTNSKYIWTKIETENQAAKLFKNIVPGQILTFRLDITNSIDSNVNVTYDIEIGKLLYCADLTPDSGSKTYVDQTAAISEDTQHLFNAINLWISEMYISVVPDGSTKVKNIPSDAAIKALYTPVDYKPVTGSKKLSSFINDGSGIEFVKENLTNVLEPGQTVCHIIKFYFDPTFGTPNSNGFADKGFSIEKFIGNFTQQKQITE